MIPKKPILDLIRAGHRFSEKHPSGLTRGIMLYRVAVAVLLGPVLPPVRVAELVERLPGRWPDDRIRREIRPALELGHGLLGLGPEHAVGADAEQRLHRLDQRPVGTAADHRALVGWRHD